METHPHLIESTEPSLTTRVYEWSEGELVIYTDHTVGEIEFFKYDDSKRALFYELALKTYTVDGRSSQEFITEREFLKIDKLKEDLIKLDVEENQYHPDLVDDLKTLFTKYEIDVDLLCDPSVFDSLKCLSFTDLCEIKIQNNRKIQPPRFTKEDLNNLDNYMKTKSIENYNKSQEKPSQKVTSRPQNVIFRESVVIAVLNILHHFHGELKTMALTMLKYEDTVEVVMVNFIELFTAFHRFEFVREFVLDKLSAVESEKFDHGITASQFLEKLEILASDKRLANMMRPPSRYDFQRIKAATLLNQNRLFEGRRM